MGVCRCRRSKGVFPSLLSHVVHMFIYHFSFSTLTLVIRWRTELWSPLTINSRLDGSRQQQACAALNDPESWMNGSLLLESET